MFSKTFRFTKSEQAFALLDAVVRDVCIAVDSPRSLAVYLLWKHKEHTQLLDLTIDANHYEDPNSFADDYLVTEFLTKSDFLETGLNTKSVAMEKFFAFEEKCRETNLRLSNFPWIPDGRIRFITNQISENFKRLMPPRSTKVVDQILSEMKWGPGVTSSSKGSHLSRYNKLQAKLEATPDLIACGAHHLVNSIWAWSTYHSGSGSTEAPASVLPTAFTAVLGNKLTTVPKNAKTDRTIAVEPHVNAALQRGIGVYLRRRLHSIGCDLRSQERNKLLAQKGSRDGSLATIDLKGASDTISKELVKLLIPSDWLTLLELSRSRYYFHEGNWVEYHKWSSMGNGYTFELESAIFYLTALAVCQYLGISTEDVSVYGDDIIIPVDAVDLFIEVLEYYGFETNKKKTFTSGLFRESCGADFFNGINVRPFFLRKRFNDLASVYTLANAIYRYSVMRCNGMAADRRFYRVRNNIVRFLPAQYRFFIPEGLEGGFHCGFSEGLPGVRRRKGRWFSPEVAFETKRLVFRASRVRKDDPILSVGSALWDMESQDSVSPSSTTDRTMYDLRERGRWAVTTLVVSEWSSSYLLV